MLTVLETTGNILLIEDDANSARLVSDYLKANSLNIDCINSGLNILTIIENNKYDLVILDLRIPGQNGFMVAENIRKSPKGVSLPIIVVSAFADEHNKLRAYKAGVNFFLSKPVNNYELLYIVRNLLALIGSIKQNT